MGYFNKIFRLLFQLRMTVFYLTDPQSELDLTRIENMRIIQPYGGELLVLPGHLPLLYERTDVSEWTCGDKIINENPAPDYFDASNFASFYMLVKKEEIEAETGNEIEFGEGLSWDLETLLTPVKKPTNVGKNYGWNTLLQRYDELCELCECRSKKFKYDGDEDIHYALNDDFFNTLFCDCKRCDKCKSIYNTTELGTCVTHCAGFCIHSP